MDWVCFDGFGDRQAVYDYILGMLNKWVRGNGRFKEKLQVLQNDKKAADCT